MNLESNGEIIATGRAVDLNAQNELFGKNINPNTFNVQLITYGLNGLVYDKFKKAIISENPLKVSISGGSVKIQVIQSDSSRKELTFNITPTVVEGELM